MANLHNRRKSDGRRVSDHVIKYIDGTMEEQKLEIETRLTQIEDRQAEILERTNKIDENITGLVDAWNAGTGAVKVVKWGTNVTKWSLSSIAIISVSAAILSRMSDWILSQFNKLFHLLGIPVGG